MLKKIQMMKKRILSICFALCFVHMTGMAQHYVGAMVDGAAAWQLDNMEDTYQMLGGGTSVGGLYQMRYDKFLLQTGLGASQVWLRQGLHVDSIARDMYDSEGYAFTYCGELYNQTHQAMVTEVMVPFMLGTKIRSFHLLVGAKLSLTIIGYTTQKAKLNTWGDYGDRYYGVLAHMPQHGFFDGKDVESKGTISFRPDARLCAEFGYSWPLTQEPVKTGAPILQVGAFVEYGIMNPLLQTADKIVEDTYTPFMNVEMNHVYTAQDREQTTIHNLRAGVRVAVLFPVAKGKNPFCRCLEGSATKYSL